MDNNFENLTKTTKMTLDPLPPSAEESKPPPPTPNKDPITCHVLDTTTGLPARNIAVSLTLLRPLGPSAPFRAQTDADGRISKWNAQDGPTLDLIFHNLAEHPDGRMAWELVFQTGQYYGIGNTFWPQVKLEFTTSNDDEKKHWHVPLLLGPWSYTTYRGS